MLQGQLECQICKDYQEFISGAGAAVVNIFCTFPAQKVIVRQQVDGVNAFTAIRQLRNESFTKLYRGVGPPLIMKAAGLSVMFGSFATFQRMILQQRPHMRSVEVNVWAGMMAGTLESLLAPFERLQTLLLLSEHKNFTRVENTVHAFLKIKKHYGLKEYYRGFSTILLRNGPSCGMFFALRQPIKDALPDTNSQLQSAFEDFLSGAVLGASISTLVYPLNVVKSNMQKRLGVKYNSVLVTLKTLYVERGNSWWRLYFGCSVNFSRSLLSWGITNAAYEYISNFIVTNL